MKTTLENENTSRRSPVTVSDIATDPLWNVPEHRAVALQHGLRASWSHPVLSSRGEVLGTFCMYYREPRSPSSQDMELLDLAAHLASSYGITARASS
jgi:GAF domain-containing protein